MKNPISVGAALSARSGIAWGQKEKEPEGGSGSFSVSPRRSEGGSFRLARTSVTECPKSVKSITSILFISFLNVQPVSWRSTRTRCRARIAAGLQRNRQRFLLRGAVRLAARHIAHRPPERRSWRRGRKAQEARRSVGRAAHGSTASRTPKPTSTRPVQRSRRRRICVVDSQRRIGFEAANRTVK